MNLADWKMEDHLVLESDLPGRLTWGRGYEMRVK